MTAYTQTTDLLSTLNYAASGDKWTIAPGVNVALSSGNAVQSAYSGTTLVNHGYIFAGGGIAAYFTGPGATIVNAADGEMVGWNYGIYATGAGSKVTNAGVVKGMSGIGTCQISATTYEFHNTGEVHGYTYGVFSTGVQGGLFENDGLVQGTTYGAGFSAGIGQVNHITNDLHGVIKGGTAGIAVISGASVFDNFGTVFNGFVAVGSNENDVVRNHGKIAGQSHLGTGNDTFDGHDGTQGKVFGELGNDKITGGAKADKMNGGLDMDILAGKGGKDFFDYDSIADSTVGALRDLIKDFRHAEHDRIDLTDIDANSLLLLDQDFTFRGQQAFSGAGQIRYILHDKAGTANDTTTIYGNVNADLAADFQIEVKGLVHFVAGDFVL